MDVTVVTSHFAHFGFYGRAPFYDVQTDTSLKNRLET